ncbi:MAG TPA: class I adenylate-forming enzyme family protein [Burkholderiaceae bacterium]|nr:class I adenylate-forming enzyme family protein [Burkholderiaceae bacterium]
MSRWLAPVPPIREETHYADQRRVRCFAERPRSVHALLEQAVARRPDGDALVAAGERLSWRRLSERAAALAAGLSARGVGRGDRVALLLGNRLEFVVATFALARLAAVAVPMSIRSQQPEVVYALENCGAAGVFVEDTLIERLPRAGEAPTLRLRISISQQPGCVGYAELASSNLPPPAPADVEEDDTAVILYTSGTTGRPKGAMLSHFNIVHSTMHYEVCMALGPNDRSVVAVPLSHVTGLVAQLHAMARCAGTIVLLDAFKAPVFLDLAERERITHTVMVPAMYALCLLQDNLARRGLAHWRIGAYGGAPMPPATIEALAQQLPNLMLMNAYGATETTSPTTIMPPGETAQRSASVGQPVPCAELKIVDAEGRELPTGETGEIWIRGPMVVGGYWANEAATATSITDGWWHSGDLGRRDAEGFLQVLDRLKDVINRGGYKVFSSEVEAVLAQHPAVLESAIVGKPCPVLGERVHAFVALREPGIDAAILQAFCAERLADYKVPETWTLGETPLPRNANGKLQKPLLRAQVRS